MMLTRVVSVLLSLSLLFVGLLTFLRNPKNDQNRYFFVVCIFAALWGLVFQSIETMPTLSWATAANIAAYILGLLLLASVLLFTYVFPAKKSKKSFYRYLILLVPTLVLSFTPLIAGTVSLDAADPSKYVFTYGPLTNLYNVVMAVGVFLIGKNLFTGHKKYSATQRAQTRITSFGFLLSFIFGVGLSTVLPLIQPQTNLDDLAPFSLVFLAGFTAFAIVKHKLFDFRAVVARAATYLLTTTILVIAYVTLAFLAKRLLFPELKVSTNQLISNIVLSIILIVSYPYIKRTFDRITNKLFFRDAYDAQVLMDTLNKTLVSNIQVETLLAVSADIIESNLKSAFCSIYIADTAYVKNRMIGDFDSKLSTQDIVELGQQLGKISQKVIYVEDFEEADNKEDTKLKSIMLRNDIEIVVRITDLADKRTSDIGFLLLGAKRSGNLYTRQDLNVLEIIANELVIAVQNALRYEEIEQFSLTLQKRVEDATKELRKSNEKLKALDEAKDEFISMASHQLRTPLTSVKGYLSMLAEGDAGKLNETQRKFIDQAFISSQRMVYLIADLLNVSRLKTGKFIIEAVPTYLPDVVQSEIAQLNETVKSRGLTMSFDKPKEYPTLMLDETKIRQVIMNFADNAIYYSKPGGTIDIKLRVTGDVAEFTVTDDGIGVPKAEQPHLFTKFYRAGNARKTRPDGTGLGLFMAKKVVVAQGGALIFNSVEGKGSTFGFRFNIPKV